MIHFSRILLMLTQLAMLVLLYSRYRKIKTLWDAVDFICLCVFICTMELMM